VTQVDVGLWLLRLVAGGYVGGVRFEGSVACLRISCSTTELPRRITHLRDSNTIMSDFRNGRPHGASFYPLLAQVLRTQVAASHDHRECSVAEDLLQGRE